MSYGLQITGNDAGGNFTVADTDLSMVNLIVTDVGRASSFNLQGGIRPGDYIFVRDPSAPGEGGYTPVQVEGPPGQGNVQFDYPFVYSIETELNGDINFVGSAWTWVSSNTVYGLRELYIYSGFEVVMDYFVVRKASTVVDLNLNVDEKYGLQLFTEAGEIALDSRSFTSNKTFYIESYLPPENNFGVLPANTQSDSLNYSAGCYVNLEWTRKNASSNVPIFDQNSITGLYIGTTSAYTIDGDINTMGSGGEPSLQIWSSHNAIFAARLGEGISSSSSPNQSTGTDTDGPDTEPDAITGTIDYVSGSSVTEGDTISFDVTTSEPSNYHTRVFRLTGSAGEAGKDFVSVTHPFSTDSQTVTLSTYDTSSAQQTFDKIYSQSYTGTYTRDRISTYTRGVDSSYTRDFTGNYIGDYSRTVPYQRDFVANYNRTLDYQRTLSRSESYTGEYSRNRTETSTRISAYTRNVTYGGNFVGNYEGIYTRGRTETLSYQRAFSRTNSYTGNYLANQEFQEGSDTLYLPIMFSSFYTRNRTSTFAGNYVRYRSGSLSYEGNYSRTSTRTRTSSYLGTYSRNRTSSYVRNRGTSSTRVLSYVGNYSRNFAGDYTRTLSYQRTTQQFFTGNFTKETAYLSNRVEYYTGNYTRNVASTNTFTRSFTNTASYSRNFTRTSSRNFVGSPYSRTLGYNRSYLGNYTNTDSFSRDFIGDYSRNFSRTLSFSRTVNAYDYVSSPKTYWKENPESQSNGGEGFGGGLQIIEITVYVGGAVVASTTASSFAPATYVQAVNGTYYHKGTLQNTIGDTTLYSIGASSSTTPPSGSATSYTRTASYSRAFAGNYTQYYSAGGDYTRSRIASFTRTIPYTGTRTSNYIGNYARSYVSGAVRTESYTGNFTSEVAYTRSRPEAFVGNYIGESTRVLQDDGPPMTIPAMYTRTRISTYTGNYQRTLNYVGQRSSSYSAAYSRTSTYTANYQGNYARTIVDSYVGNYSRNYGGNFTSTYTRNRTNGVTYTGDFSGTRSGDFVGNYTRFTTSTFNRTRLEEVTRYSTYTRTPTYTGNYSGNYTRTSTRSRPTTLSYNRTLSYIGNYARDYSRTLTSGYTRQSTYSRTVSYEGNYTGDFTRDIVNNIDSTATRTSTYTRTDGVSYERTITSSYVGDYIGNYTGTSTRTPTDTSEIGWQGERFVIELRRGSDSTSMAAPRGDSNVEVLDSKEFTLIDNDAGLFVSMSPQVVHHTATQHELVFDFYTEGSSAVPARIYRGSSIIVNSFNLASNQRTTMTVNEVPPEGSSYTYALRIFDGTNWILASYYQVSKVSNTDYVSPPPTTTYTATYTPTYSPTFTATPGSGIEN